MSEKIPRSEPKYLLVIISSKNGVPSKKTVESVCKSISCLSTTAPDGKVHREAAQCLICTSHLIIQNFQKTGTPGLRFNKINSLNCFIRIFLRKLAFLLFWACGTEGCKDHWFSLVPPPWSKTLAFYPLLLSVTSVHVNTVSKSK